MGLELKKLGEICTIEKGNIGIKKAVSGDYPLVVMGVERKSHNKYQFDDEAVVIPLVSSTGHGHRSMKRIHYQNGKFSVGSILCAVIPKDKAQLSAQYLFRYLDLYKEQELVGRMRGMANVSLPMKSIAEVEIPIPPLDEQRKIVSEFEAIESSNQNLTSEQSHQLDLLKKLRQQILQDALQGKLVLQDPNDEPASKLLGRIKAEKERLISEKKIKKDKQLTESKPEEIPFEIPENWEWCRLGQVAKQITDGEHQTPPRISEGKKLLSAKNIRNGYIDFTNIDFISENHYQKSITRCKPQKGDILIVSVGATIGRSAILDIDEKFAIVRSVALIKPLMLINNKYIKVILDSPLLQKDINERAWGTAQPCLYLNQIKQLSIPLPPFNEQLKIVAKIEQLMTLCDELENSIQQNQKYTQELLQVALKEALEPK